MNDEMLDHDAVRETYDAILQNEFGEDYASLPTIPAFIVKSESEEGTYHFEIEDDLEYTVIQLANQFLQDEDIDAEKRELVTINFLNWALTTYRPNSIIIANKLSELITYGHDSYKIGYKARKIIYENTKEYPDLNNYYALERLYFGLLMNVERGIEFDSHAQSFISEEIKKLEENSLNKDNVLLDQIKFTFYRYCDNYDKIIENLDVFLKIASETTDEDDFTDIILACNNLDKSDIAQKAFDAFYPSHKSLEMAICAYQAGHNDISIELFESPAEDILQPEYETYLTWYFHVLLDSKKYNKIFEIAPKLYTIFDDDWKDELFDAIKKIAFETGNFDTFNQIQKLAEEDFEKDSIIEGISREVFADYFSNDNQTEKSIIGVTIDLKYNDTDGVQICEFNTLSTSGLDGYKAAYEYDLRNELKAFYELHTGLIPHSHVKRFIGQPLGIEGFYKTMLGEQLNGFRTKSNSSPSFSSRVGYKDLTMLDAQDLDSENIFPKGVVLSKADFKKELKKFIATLSPTDLVVLKPVHASIGEGVKVLAKKDILSTCERLFNKREFTSEIENAWKEDIQPNFVIQKCAKSDPVLVRDGREYDGTMRFVVSMILDHKTGEVTMHPHGAYWKLPPKSLSEITAPEDLQKSIVSQPPSKLTEEQKERPFSEKVDDLTFAKVNAHLDQYLRSYAPILAKSPEEYVAELKATIESSKASEVRKSAVIDVATNDSVGFVLESYFRHNGKTDYVELIDTIENFARTAKKKSPAGDFARAVMGIPKNTKTGIMEEIRYLASVAVPQLQQPIITPDETALLALRCARNSHVRERQRKNSNLLSDRISLFIAQGYNL